MILTSDYKRVRFEWLLPILDTIIADYTDRFLALSKDAERGARDFIASTAGCGRAFLDLAAASRNN